MQVKTCIWDRPENIRANIEASVLRGLETFGAEEEPHDGRMVVVGFSPSVRDHLDELKSLHARGDRVVCVNGAHDWLIGHGLVPHDCVLVDSWEKLKDLVTPHKGVRYWVASQCHPSLFDKLQGFDVTLWHAYTNKEQTGFAVEELVPDAWVINASMTGALGCMNLGHLWGFRRFTYFGLDSSFRDGEKHAIPMEEAEENEVVEIEHEGRKFKTTYGLIAQAQQFERMYTVVHHRSRIRVVGDGLIPHAARTWSRLKYGLELADV